MNVKKVLLNIELRNEAQNKYFFEKKGNVRIVMESYLKDTQKHPAVWVARRSTTPVG